MDYAIGVNPGVIPWMTPTVAGGGVPITISTAWLSHDNITFREFSKLKVICENTAEHCTAVINSKAIPLTEIEDDGTNKRYETDLSGYNVGVCTTETVNLFVSNTTTYGYDNSLTITVTASSYIRPMYYIQGLLETNWDTSNVPKPEIIIITDIKRVDLAHKDKIILRQKPRERTIKGRGQYKSVKYPVAIDIETSHSDDRKDALLQEVVRICQLYPRFLPSNEDYDYMEWAQDGEDASMAMAKRWKMIYEVKLVKILQKID